MSRRVENIRVRENELLFCADLNSICADLNGVCSDLKGWGADLNAACADLNAACADLKFLFFTNQTKHCRYTRYTATFLLRYSCKLSVYNHLQR